MGEEYSFTIVNDQGIEVKCDTIMTLEPKEVINGSGEYTPTYIVYTDYTLDEKENFNVYISEIIKDGESFKLENVKDYQSIPKLFEAVQKAYNDLNLVE